MSRPNGSLNLGRATLEAVVGGGILIRTRPYREGEPVAVMYEDGSLLSKADCGDNFEICCKVQTPLYDTQQPAPDVVEEWSRAFLQIAVVLEALTSSDSDERLSRINAADVLGEAFATLRRIRQKPAPDVSALVEALEACRDELKWMIERHNQQDQNDGSWLYDHQTVVEADAALATHRKQGDRP